MKRLFGLILISSSLTMGCIPMKADFKPSQGLIVTNYTAPLTTDLQGVQDAKKQSSVSSLYIYDPIFTGMTFAFGNVSITKAMKLGNQQKLSYADYSVFGVLGIFGHLTVTTYGE